MTEKLRPRLDRLQELSKNLNSSADRIANVVQGVETHLNEMCHLGVYAAVVVSSDGSGDMRDVTTTYLCYGRIGPKFRIHVSEVDEHCGEPVNDRVTLWANCSRDLKLASYKKLPELLDKLIQQVESTLAEVEADTEAIESLIPMKGKKKEATS